MDLGGEFLFMASPQTGCVGNLSRENFFKPSPDLMLNLGFIIAMGYSEDLEKAVIASLMLPSFRGRLYAGITGCSMWSRGILEGRTKVIAVVGDEPFFDCTEYLNEFAKLLEEIPFLFKNKNGNYLSYYAEKFGYDRFFVYWEGENPHDMAVSNALSDFELDGTREVVGGSSTEEFPPFLGATIAFHEITS
jgi:hypothetical protein